MPVSTSTYYSAYAIFAIFLKLGLTSFGGPVAHLGYFYQEFVVRRHWLSEVEYADLVALCQFLPGPASSQVGMAIGYQQAGYRGALAAWLGFTLPSALLLLICGLGVGYFNTNIPVGLIQGLKIVAVAVVAHAVWQMARQLCPDFLRILLMCVACVVVLLFPGSVIQLGVMLFAAIFGVLVFRSKQQLIVRVDPQAVVPIWSVKQSRISALWLCLFFALLGLLPLFSHYSSNDYAAIIDMFYRSGALVFGGGHVLLPLLQRELVDPGWLTADVFISGYALAQAVPGPLFSFAAFLGAAMQTGLSAICAGLIALVAIFLPSFFILFALLPIWARLKQHIIVQAALKALNAAVVGILLAVFFHPIWTSTVTQPLDLLLVLVSYVALVYVKLPVWLLVVIAAVFGWIFLT